MTPLTKTASAIAVVILWLSGCGGRDTSAPVAAAEIGTPAAAVISPPEEKRPQDSRVYSVEVSSLPFAALPGTTVETDRWFGTLDGSGYRIEVPKNWNGFLVMWAHGYDGSGASLTVSDPPIRRHLVENGYAWAASSYSKNNYDVRAGIEDTNALALAFTRIAGQNNRVLPPPSKTYIIGGSMGGHVAAAAVEQETMNTAINKARYDGAVPMCAVLGDTELFDYLNAYQLAAQYLGGVPATTFPVADFAASQKKIKDALWSIFPVVPTTQGRKLEALVMNLTGGTRPIFADSFKLKPFQDAVWAHFGNDGTIDGILAKSVTDTSKIIYQLDADPALSAEEISLNNSILRVTPAPDANRLRSDGLRWVPKVNGQFNAPVVTMHTLGDLVVPFKMEQIYRQRATANGSDQWLVQRAIRAPAHCDFSIAEQVAAFEAMIGWDQRGFKPAGDDVLISSVIGSSSYGCAFTDNSTGPDDSPAIALARALMPACPRK
jgi:pimeloyl-ACP methyl ester carboxylesterase